MALVAINLIKNVVLDDEFVDVISSEVLEGSVSHILDDFLQGLQTLELFVKEISFKADKADFKLEIFNEFALFRDGIASLQKSIKGADDVINSVLVEVSDVAVRTLEDVLEDSLLQSGDVSVSKVSVQN